MLVLDISKIPPDGLDLDRELEAGEVHLQGDDGFVLAAGRLRCHVEKGEDETVHVRGRLFASLKLECGRCLAGFEKPVDQELDLFYLPHHAETADQEEEEDVELNDRDLVVGYYRGDRLDLGETVREQLFLGLPMKRLCREDCRGLCASCGVDRNATACACSAAAAETGFSALAKLLQDATTRRPS